MVAQLVFCVHAVDVRTVSDVGTEPNDGLICRQGTLQRDTNTDSQRPNKDRLGRGMEGANRGLARGPRVVAVKHGREVIRVGRAWLTRVADGRLRRGNSGIR